MWNLQNYCQTHWRESSLHFAVFHGKFDLVKQLITEDHVDINAICEHEPYRYYTPLHVSCWEGNYAITEYLVKMGAEINVQNQNGYTPLNGAIYNGYYKIAKFLIKNGADPNLQEKFKGYTPLITACTRFDVTEITTLIEMMLENGANVSICTYSGISPLDFAYAKPDDGRIALLVKYGAKPGKFGQEAMEKALRAEYENPSIQMQNGKEDVKEETVNPSIEIKNEKEDVKEEIHNEGEPLEKKMKHE